MLMSLLRYCFVHELKAQTTFLLYDFHSSNKVIDMKNGPELSILMPLALTI